MCLHWLMANGLKWILKTDQSNSFHISLLSHSPGKLFDIWNNLCDTNKHKISPHLSLPTGTTHHVGWIKINITCNYRFLPPNNLHVKPSIYLPSNYSRVSSLVSPIKDQLLPPWIWIPSPFISSGSSCQQSSHSTESSTLPSLLHPTHYIMHSYYFYTFVNPLVTLPCPSSFNY